MTVAVGENCRIIFFSHERIGFFVKAREADELIGRSVAILPKTERNSSGRACVGQSFNAVKKLANGIVLPAIVDGVIQYFGCEFGTIGKGER